VSRADRAAELAASDELAVSDGAGFADAADAVVSTIAISPAGSPAGVAIAGPMVVTVATIVQL